MKNLAENPVHAARIETLTKLLQDWQLKLGDTQPLTVPGAKFARVDLSGGARPPDVWQPEWIRKKYFGEGR